jgi:hypothetical protein
VATQILSQPLQFAAPHLQRVRPTGPPSKLPLAAAGADEPAAAAAACELEPATAAAGVSAAAAAAAVVEASSACNHARTITQSINQCYICSNKILRGGVHASHSLKNHLFVVVFGR